MKWKLAQSGHMNRSCAAKQIYGKWDQCKLFNIQQALSGMVAAGWENRIYVRERGEKGERK